MIITKQKTMQDILQALGKDSVFIIGCSECATLCHTGGEAEVQDMKKKLETQKIPVRGWTILDPACHLTNNKRLLKPCRQQLNQSKKILVLSCGNGIQTVGELFPDKQVIAGTDTLFVGEIKHPNEFEKNCTLCGECLLDLFGGVCPVSCCPKSMLNGPCGGSIQGQCEINSELECIWDTVYKRLKQQGNIAVLKTIQKPKNWSKSNETRRRIPEDDLSE